MTERRDIPNVTSFDLAVTFLASESNAEMAANEFQMLR